MTKNAWGEQVVDLVNDLCRSRSKGGWSILITALGEDNVKYINTKLEATMVDKAHFIPLVRGTVDYVKETMHDTALPRIIIASAVAFTGMTFKNCDVVISSGLTRKPVMETVTGLLQLVDTPTTHEEEEQVAGRCGRDTVEGVVLFLS